MDPPPVEVRAMIKRAKFTKKVYREMENFLCALFHLEDPETFRITLEELNIWFGQGKIGMMKRYTLIVPVEGATEEEGSFYFRPGDKSKLKQLGKPGLVFVFYRKGMIVPGGENALRDQMAREIGYWETFSSQKNEAWRFCARPLPRDKLLPAELEPLDDSCEFPMQKFLALCQLQQQQHQQQQQQLLHQHHHHHTSNSNDNTRVCAAEGESTQGKGDIKAQGRDQGCVRMAEASPAAHALTGTPVDRPCGDASTDSDDEDGDHHRPIKRIKLEGSLHGGCAKRECGSVETSAATISSSSTTTSTSSTTTNGSSHSTSSNGSNSSTMTTLTTTTTLATNTPRPPTPLTHTHAHSHMDLNDLVFSTVKQGITALIVVGGTGVITGALVDGCKGLRLVRFKDECMCVEDAQRALEELLDDRDGAACPSAAAVGAIAAEERPAPPSAAAAAAGSDAAATATVDDSWKFTPCGGDERDNDVEDLPVLARDPWVINVKNTTVFGWT